MPRVLCCRPSHSIERRPSSRRNAWQHDSSVGGIASSVKEMTQTSSSLHVFMVSLSFYLQKFVLTQIPRNSPEFQSLNSLEFTFEKLPFNKNMSNMKGLQNTSIRSFPICLISDPAERTTVSCPSNRALPIGMWSESHRDSQRWRQDCR